MTTRQEKNQNRFGTSFTGGEKKNAPECLWDRNSYRGNQDPRSKERARDSSTMPGPVFCLRKKQAGKQKLRSTLPSCNPAPPITLGTRRKRRKSQKVPGTPRAPGKWRVRDCGGSLLACILPYFSHSLLLFELSSWSLLEGSVPPFLFRFQDSQELQGSCFSPPRRLPPTLGPRRTAYTGWPLDKTQAAQPFSPKPQNSPPTGPPGTKLTNIQFFFLVSLTRYLSVLSIFSNN